MRNLRILQCGLGLTIALATVACGGTDDSMGSDALPEGCTVQVKPGADDQTAVQTALIEAKEGSTVCFAAGKFSFKAELSLDVKGVTLRGAGREKTIFDFTKQDTGPNGLTIRSDNVTMEDFGLLNPPGDGIRGDKIANITFRRIAVLWDGDSTDNGNYGLYPVGSSNVVMDSCLVSGARDSGLYIGQTQGALVTSNESSGNVSGMELENSTDVIVHDNYFHDNVGGIVVLNVPNLPVQDGKRTNIFNNRIENNSIPNFAVGGTFNILIPSGIGVLVISSDDNEIHNNQIKGNITTGVLIMGQDDAFFPPVTNPNFNKFSEGNYVHDNEYEGNGTDPQTYIAPLSTIRPMPDVMWDGCVDATAMDDGHLKNCVVESKGTFVNFDLCTDPPNPNQDLTPVTCTYEPLPTQ